MPRTVPLSVQLVFTFVGLIVGTTAVLTTAAYTYSRNTLEDEVRRTLIRATETREQTITQLFNSRQQRAEGLLGSIQALCGEPLRPGVIAWAPDCVQTLVTDFRASERAVGALLTYHTRRISRAGAAVPLDEIPAGALAAIVRAPEPGGAIQYAMTAMLEEASLNLLFGHDDVAELFEQGPVPEGRDAVFLVDGDGQPLTAPRAGAPGTLPPDAARELMEQCASGAHEILAIDYRGILTMQTVRPIAAVAGACIVARVDYADVVAPAERLRAALVARGAWFVLLGAALSLVAAQWIAAPVRRLVMSARQLQTGRFDRPIPVAGPSEVRALGRAFNAMANDLAELLAREQTARREAEDANRSKDQFLATVSHELRTPLSAILGWSHMLRLGQLAPDRVQHGLEVIERNARAQKQLIEDLLDVSRIVSNRLRIATGPVRLADVADAALDAVRPQAAAKNIDIETSLADRAVVLGDPQRLQQVVWNLAWNAIKFTQPSGRVRLEVTASANEAMIAVSDTGIGIPSAFLPYVFEWFRQSDSAAKTQTGLGLGLGIVRHLVQLHGGSVRAESQGEGRGATFVVTLPLHTAAEPAEPRELTELSEELRHTLDGIRVVIVEDDEDTRELLRLTLEGAGASVAAVASADRARIEVLSDPPDVLVSDIRMPGESGYELIQSLRAAGVATPAVAVTAYARREDAKAAVAAGFHIHLPKPVDAPRLVRAVARLARGGG